MILGNSTMIDAYKEGVPGNGKPFPDGAKMAKIHWNPKKQETYPGQPTVPGTQHDVDFMVKDSKRFADSGGWGWGAFEYDAASDTFRPATVGGQSAAGKRREVRVRVPHGGEETRLRFHGVRKAVNGSAERDGVTANTSKGKRAMGRFTNKIVVITGGTSGIMSRSCKTVHRGGRRGRGDRAQPAVSRGRSK